MQEYPLLIYVYERKEALLNIDDDEIIGKEKIDNYTGSGLFKPMIEDTKALKEEENMFNNKFNINNNYMNNFGNPFSHNNMSNNNTYINNTNNHINNNNIDDDIHNVLPDDYMKKPDKVN